MTTSEMIIACNPPSFARAMSTTRKSPKRRLFTLEAFPLAKWLGGRCGQETIWAPTQDNPLLGGMIMQPQFSAPYHKRFSLPSVGNEMVNARVRILLNACCPATVAGFVISAVVDAVNALLAGSLAHIFKKVLELKPAFTDLNAPRAVSEIVNTSRVIASLNHGAPDIMNAGPGPTVGARRLTHGRAFLAPAATGLRPPGLGQHSAQQFPNRPALTAADVNRGIMSFAARIRDDGPAVEGLPSQIICHTHTLTVDNARDKG